MGGARVGARSRADRLRGPARVSRLGAGRARGRVRARRRRAAGRDAVAPRIGRRDRPILDTVAQAIAEAAQRRRSHRRPASRARRRAWSRSRNRPTRPGSRRSRCRRTSCTCAAGTPRCRRDRAVAVVGTRRATGAGRSTAVRIATALAAADATVVSGLAFGIDGAAHEATLRAGGTTVAVIGGGHARVGPARTPGSPRRSVASGGAVVSELAPDVRAVDGHLPAAEPDHQRPHRRDGRGRGAGRVRRAHHRVLGARAGSRAASSCPARSTAGIGSRLPGVPARVPGGDPHRGRRSRSSSPISATRAPTEPDRDALAAATSQDLGRTEAAVARGLVDGHATVDELVATTDLPVATVLAALTLLERRGLTSGAHGRYRPAGTLSASRPRSGPASRCAGRSGAVARAWTPGATLTGASRPSVTRATVRDPHPRRSPGRCSRVLYCGSTSSRSWPSLSCSACTHRRCSAGHGTSAAASRSGSAQWWRSERCPSPGRPRRPPRRSATSCP